VTTDEERELVEQVVRSAVERVGGRPGMVISEFIVVAHTSGWDDDGNEISQVVRVPDGSWSRVLGLLREAQVRYETEIIEADE
jgi:hypothetical protein